MEACSSVICMPPKQSLEPQVIARTGLVIVERADTLPEGWKLWLQWKRARRAAGDESAALQSDIRVLEADGGRYMGFIRMIAERTA